MLTVLVLGKILQKCATAHARSARFILRAVKSGATDADNSATGFCKQVAMGISYACPVSIGVSLFSSFYLRALLFRLVPKFGGWATA